MKKLILFYFLVVTGFAFAQTNDASALAGKMEALVKAYAKEQRFNGAVLVAQNGQVLYQAGAGYKNAEEKTLNDATSIFQVGSVTKQITAAVVMQLVQEKKLSLQDKLSSYFPGFKNGDKITIENLLTHTSGLFNYTNDTVLMKSDVTRHISQKEMLDLFLTYPPDFEPGAKFNYSNSGYSVLGYIIEKVTGKPYEQNVRERILQPLGMTNSGFDFTNLKSDKKTKGYFSLQTTPSRTAPIVDSTISYAAGALYTTVGDLYKWERGVSSGKILNANLWQDVFTPRKEKYGFGWSIDTLYNRQITAHTGGIHGYASYILRFPKEQLVVILADNASSSSLVKLGRSLAAIALHEPYETLDAKKEIQVDKATLESYAGVYELAPTFQITVRVDGNKLKAQATNQPEFELFAEKENLFYLKVVDAKVEFVKDPQGNVIEMILYQNGMTPRGKKIK